MNIKPFAATLLTVLLISFHPYSATAQKQKNNEPFDFVGLSVFIDAGVTLPDDHTAAFYNGRQGNQNTIERILYSEMFGYDIWQNLVNQELISPSAIPSYHELVIAEPATTEYSIAMQIGLGFRYDFVKRFGMIARFDYMKLTARGIFNLSSGAPSSILSNRDLYIPCGIFGTETRTYIDLGLFKSFAISDNLRFVLDFGLNINSTKVLTNSMEIGGKEYSILDVWSGNSPDMGMQSYEYYQSGVGYGLFLSPNIEYILPNAMGVDIGFTFYYTKINIPGHTDFAPQYTFYIRFLTNKF